LAVELPKRMDEDVSAATVIKLSKVPYFIVWDCI